ncbi:Putative aminopeptidase ysdC [Acholeplasma oculi]|uniref:Endo-1,4-beta-glucanase n=1 Tax=Acholeplasma oculi TaxID=35623 RepID=A0A061AJ48_9MOLU|nr:hypothetical protein [Acholeplasma oculi]CDR31017.1 Endo-1,4-beta-glucanase [Acholeplasma oculi]SKC36389.1 endoglucanase [Acholeplasma oculi]SUT90493.1 Putative aminopeptidase ysdC [Acholeplasma oculi]
MKTYSLLTELSQLDAIASNEREVSNYLVSKINKPHIKDGLGSIIFKEGVGPKLLLTTNMDEPGLIVTGFTKDGFIKFQPVGIHFSQSFLHQMFTITTKNGKIHAVSTYKPYSYLQPEERKSEFPLKDMLLDAGFKSDIDAQKAGIEIGDMITYQHKINRLGNDLVIGKGLSNRSAISLLIELLNELNTSDVELNVAFTTQKSMSMKGAKTVSYMVEPDISIAVYAYDAMDLPGLDSRGRKLGSGPMVAIYDQGLIAHPKLLRFVREVAQKEKISIQEMYLETEASEGGYLSLSKTGSACISIGIPVRNRYSSQEIVSLEDILETKRLLKSLILALNSNTVDKILFE